MLGELTEADFKIEDIPNLSDAEIDRRIQSLIEHSVVFPSGKSRAAVEWSSAARALAHSDPNFRSKLTFATFVKLFTPIFSLMQAGNIDREFVFGIESSAYRRVRIFNPMHTLAILSEYVFIRKDESETQLAEQAVQNLQLLLANEDLFKVFFKAIFFRNRTENLTAERIALLKFLCEPEYCSEEMFIRFFYQRRTNNLAHSYWSPSISGDLQADKALFNEITSPLPRLRLLTAESYIRDRPFSDDLGDYEKALEIFIDLTKAGNAMAKLSLINEFLQILSYNAFHYETGEGDKPIIALFIKAVKELLSIDPNNLIFILDNVLAYQRDEEEANQDHWSVSIAKYKRIFEWAVENDAALAEQVAAIVNLIKLDSGYADYATPSSVAVAASTSSAEERLARLQQHCRVLLYASSVLPGQALVQYKQYLKAYFAAAYKAGKPREELFRFLQEHRDQTELWPFDDAAYHELLIDLHIEFVNYDIGSVRTLQRVDALLQPEIQALAAAGVSQYLIDYSFRLRVYYQCGLNDAYNDLRYQLKEDHRVPYEARCDMQYHAAMRVFSDTLGETDDAIETAIRTFEYIYDSKDEACRDLQYQIYMTLNGADLVAPGAEKPPELKMPMSIMQRFVEYYGAKEEKLPPRCSLRTLTLPMCREILSLQEENLQLRLAQQPDGGPPPKRPKNS